MMVVVMKDGASMKEVSHVLKTVETMGLTPHLTREGVKTSVGVVGNTDNFTIEKFVGLPGVEEVAGVKKPFKLASREFHPLDSVVDVSGVEVGGRRVVVMAGPCAVESEEQLLSAAYAVKQSGARILRGGAYKPRTSPYSFQGLQEDGLRILKKAREETGMPVVTEVISPELVGICSEYADVLQVGARNMQNFALLEEVGRSGKPVLLKRGMMAGIEELLLSAEYILAGGNSQVMLCERGIRTFETYTRNTLDIAAVQVLKQLSHLPVIVDPSHATGRRELVGPAARAGIAAGADGLIIEAHPCPDQAMCDGAQSLTPEMLEEAVTQVGRVALAVDREL